jgi:hypothetical protein
MEPDRFLANARFSRKVKNICEPNGEKNYGKSTGLKNTPPRQHK